ncbi:MAG TPA: hypothetical protein V6C86_08250 [Oculatellaceae cyanobacterium]
MNQSVVGIVHSLLEAESLVNALKASGHPESDVSVILPDKAGGKDFAHENTTKAPEGAVAGASAGGVVGGTLGLLAGIGTLAVPGVGPLIAAGPIMATLSGVAVGATAGGLCGGLIGMGVPEYEAKIYEGKVQDGNILLAVNCSNNTELKEAEETFKRYDASDIHRVGEEKIRGN